VVFAAVRQRAIRNDVDALQASDASGASSHTMCDIAHRVAETLPFASENEIAVCGHYLTRMRRIGWRRRHWQWRWQQAKYWAAVQVAHALLRRRRLRWLTTREDF